MGCPDASEIAEIVTRSMSGTRGAALEAHLAECAECRELAFALAAEVDAGADAGAVTRPRIGRFELVEELGAGAMGRVYRAHDPELGREVAIKVRRAAAAIDAEGDDRLRREAQALARLAHPNVVAVYEAGRHSDAAYVVMEYVDGVTLDRWAATPRPAREVIALLAGAARGIAAAHAVGLVHRDVKPRNIFVSSTGEAKVGDFGLVRLAPGPEPHALDAAELTITRTGSLLGTPAYMAPEQLRGEPATAHSDQFSFCVTLFEALTGARPFTGKTVEDQAAAIARGAPAAALAELPARARRVLARGLAADPARRFPSMTALLAVLAPHDAAARWRIGAALLAALSAVAVVRAIAPGDAPACEIFDGDARAAFGPHHLVALVARSAREEPRAAGAVLAVSRLLADYGQRWTATQLRVCRAGAHVAQRSCLERRAQQARDLGAVLAMPDHGALLGDAPRAVEALPDPESCEREVAAPGDALDALAPVRAALDQRIDHVINLVHAGRIYDAQRDSAGLVVAARQLASPRLTARAALAQVTVDTGVEQYGALEALLDAAARAAAEAHDDALIAEAWTTRIVVVAEKLGRIEEARRWLPVADAALVRAGDPPELRILFHIHEAMLARERGAFDEAQRALEAALVDRTRTRPDAVLQIAQLHNDLGVVLMSADRRAAAREHHETALRGLRAAYGDLHPDVVTTLNNLGALFLDREPRTAIPYFQEARRVGERLLGPDSDAVTSALNNEGIAWYRLYDYAAAARIHRQVLAVERRRFGPIHPKVAFALANLAASLLEVGDRPGGVQAYREAVAILEARLGPHDMMLARARRALADALQRTADIAGALATYRAALSTHGDVRSTDVAITEVELGELLAVTGARDAAPHFARAVELLGWEAGRPGYALRAHAGVVYCDALAGRVDRARLAALEGHARGELEPDEAGIVALARARSYAVLGDRARARALAAASLAAYHDFAPRRAAVERATQDLR